MLISWQMRMLQKMKRDFMEKKGNMLMKMKHDFMEIKGSIHKILISRDILVDFHMEDSNISTCSFLVKMLISWLKKNKCWFYGKKEFWKKIKHDFMEQKARLDKECWNALWTQVINSQSACLVSYSDNLGAQIFHDFLLIYLSFFYTEYLLVKIT